MERAPDMRNVFGLLYHDSSRTKGQLCVRVKGHEDDKYVVATQVKGCKDLYTFQASVKSNFVELRFGKAWGQDVFHFNDGMMTVYTIDRDSLLIGEWGGAIKKMNLKTGNLGVILTKGIDASFVTGEDVALGQWDPLNAPPTTPLKPGISATPVVLATDKVEYKCVKEGEEGKNIWEEPAFVNKTVTSAGPFVTLSEWGRTGTVITEFEEKGLVLNSSPNRLTKYTRAMKWEGDVGEKNYVDGLKRLFGLDTDDAPTEVADIEIPLEPLPLDRATNCELIPEPKPKKRSFKSRAAKLLRRLFRCKGSI